MQHPPIGVLAPRSHSEKKPKLSSYDSGSECSLDHWLEVYWLVEEEYLFAKRADSEEAIEVTVFAGP